MGNILKSQPDINLIKHLNNFYIKVLTEKEHRQLERFKFETKYKQNNNSLFTTYEYQRISSYLPTNFILCKSSTVDDIIKNILLGEESIAHLSWESGERKILYIKDILMNPNISCHKVNLIEIHSILTSKSCKTLRNHPYLKNQDDRTYFSENDIINGIMTNFVIYPVSKMLLLTDLLLNHNIFDIKLNILNLYISMLYSF